MTRGLTNFRNGLSSGRLSLCMAANHARAADFPLVVEAAGFDSFYVDLEHYTFSIETAAMLCATALRTEVASLVRVPGPDPHTISRILDGGACGVIVPNVDTAAEARTVVDAARFPPFGRRGVPGPNSATGFRAYGVVEAMAELDSPVVVVTMLESPDPIQVAEEIAAVDGVDVLLVGSNGLALRLGIPGQLRHQKIIDAFARVGDVCRRHGKVLGVAGVRADAEHAARIVDLGGRFIISGSDTGYLLAAARSSSAEFRGIERRLLASALPAAQMDDEE